MDAADRLMGAAAALRLAERVGGDHYALGDQGAALLGNPGLAEMIAHHRHFYADLADAPALLRGRRARGGLSDYWPYAIDREPRALCPEKASAYSALMAASQPTVAADVLDAYDVARHKRLLDVGGGEGVFLTAAARRAPDLALTLFDLPAVTGRGREALGRAGLLERAEIVSGDFLTDPLPRGADLISLVRILHDHDDAGIATLLRATREAVAPGGALLIAEPMSAAPKRDKVADAYFALYLHAMGRGRARTPADLMARAEAAGWRNPRLIPTRSPFLLRIIVAHG